VPGPSSATSSPLPPPSPTMSLTINSETKKIATVTLAGEVDSLSAREFQKEIEKLAAEKPDVLLVMAEQLQFISSAGLRVLIFAKQKMGTHLSVYVVKAPESVVETLEKTGLQNSLHIVDHYL
jgi:anti-anti-sigma factor